MKKRFGIRLFVKGAALPVVALCVLLLFLTALGNLSSGHRQKDKHQLESALRRAAVACYASEGIYPPDLDYLKEHYAIQIDEANYYVVYDVFAENLMPDITVLEK